MFKRPKALLVAAVAVVGIPLLPSSAEAASGSITCGTGGHAAYTIAYARKYGLNTNSQGPGPTGAQDISARIAPTLGVGDPDPLNQAGLPEVGIWTFVGNLANITFGASQAIAGGSLPPNYLDSQCTGQAGWTGTVVESHSNSHVLCPEGTRVVVWSDGWGNHWVRYRSTSGGAYKRVKTMFSNYQTLRMGSAFINEREVFDVTLVATTSGPTNWADDWIPSWNIRCNSDGQDPKVQ